MTKNKPLIQEYISLLSDKSSVQPRKIRRLENLLEIAELGEMRLNHLCDFLEKNGLDECQEFNKANEKVETHLISRKSEREQPIALGLDEEKSNLEAPGFFFTFGKSLLTLASKYRDFDSPTTDRLASEYIELLRSEHCVDQSRVEKLELALDISCLGEDILDRLQESLATTEPMFSKRQLLLSNDDSLDTSVAQSEFRIMEKGFLNIGSYLAQIQTAEWFSGRGSYNDIERLAKDHIGRLQLLTSDKMNFTFKLLELSWFEIRDSLGTYNRSCCINTRENITKRIIDTLSPVKYRELYKEIERAIRQHVWSPPEIERAARILASQRIGSTFDNLNKIEVEKISLIEAHTAVTLVNSYAARDLTSFVVWSIQKNGNCVPNPWAPLWDIWRMGWLVFWRKNVCYLCSPIDQLASTYQQYILSRAKEQQPNLLDKPTFCDPEDKHLMLRHEMFMDGGHFIKRGDSYV